MQGGDHLGRRPFVSFPPLSGSAGCPVGPLSERSSIMRQFIIASHAHFAAGINESISLLSGERDNVRTLSMYVDGNNDLAAAAAKMLDEIPEGEDLVVCTDLFGGSVNNEFTTVIQRRPNTYLVTNMNLPLLIQLLFAEEGRDTAEVIREVCAAEETRVKFVNDLLDGEDEDDEF